MHMIAHGRMKLLLSIVPCFPASFPANPHVGDESAALDNFAEACVQTGMFLIQVPVNSFSLLLRRACDGDVFIMCIFRSFSRWRQSKSLRKSALFSLHVRSLRRSNALFSQQLQSLNRSSALSSLTRALQTYGRSVASTGHLLLWKLTMQLAELNPDANFTVA